MEIFNVSSALWKAQTLFIKLVYRSLIERSTAENASFYTKLLCHKPGEIESGVQSGYITKNGVLPVTTFFLENFASVYESRIKSWFDVPTNQMLIFILLKSIGVLFESAFSLWVSLRYYHMTIIIEDEIVSYKANLFPVGIWMEISNW